MEKPNLKTDALVFLDIILIFKSQNCHKKFLNYK